MGGTGGREGEHGPRSRGGRRGCGRRGGAGEKGVGRCVRLDVETHAGGALAQRRLGHVEQLRHVSCHAVPVTTSMPRRALLQSHHLEGGGCRRPSGPRQSHGLHQSRPAPSPSMRSRAGPPLVRDTRAPR